MGELSVIFPRRGYRGKEKKNQKNPKQFPLLSFPDAVSALDFLIDSVNAFDAVNHTDTSDLLLSMITAIAEYVNKKITAHF